MSISKNIKKYETERSRLNLNKHFSGRRITESTQENINLQDKLYEDPRISAIKNGWTLVKVHLTESLSAI